MRIGQFSDSFLPVVDGVGRVMYSYARTLTDMGHQVMAVSVRPGGKLPDGLSFDFSSYYGLPLPGNGPYRMGLPRLDPGYQWAMRHAPLDIAHAHSPFAAGWEAERAARRQGIPLVGTFHSKVRDDFVKATGSQRVADQIIRRVVAFYRCCDEVWAVSEGTAQVLHEYGYDGEIRVMPNGVEVRQADPSAEREAAKKWALQDSSVLLFVGQQNFKKNIGVLLAACALLKQRGARFQLVLAGQGPDQRAIAEQVRALGLADQTIMTGHIADTRLLDGLYARATLMVFPSLYDNAPMVVREAAAMGTPSVLVRGSCAAEVVRDRENGYLCEDDPHDLCRVITEALADPALDAVGARARAEIPLSWRAIMDQALARYADLIDLRAAAGRSRKA